MRPMLPVLLVLLLLAACRPGAEPEMSRAEAGRPASADSLLPEAAAATRSRLLAAARARDFAALDTAVGGPREEPFVYSFGYAEEANAVAYWRARAAAGAEPLRALAAILEGAPAQHGDRYVWPAWAETPLDSLSAGARREAADLVGVAAFEEMREVVGYYTGPRTAVRADGLWLYYVAGD